MTPRELAERLRRLQATLATLPADVERVVAQEAPKASPPAAGVSVRITRTGEGVQVALSGRGARAASRRLARRVRARQGDLLAKARWSR